MNECFYVALIRPVWCFFVVVVFSMAVPFVQDWDLVQTLGEGAYGE